MVQGGNRKSGGKIECFETWPKVAFIYVIYDILY